MITVLVLGMGEVGCTCWRSKVKLDRIDFNYDLLDAMSNMLEDSKIRIKD